MAQVNRITRLKLRLSSRISRYNVLSSMLSGRITSELAVLTVVCVLMIFLFPSVQGSYSMVHEPVTALLAARAAVRLRFAIVQGVLRSAGNPLISPQVVLSWISVPNAESQLLSLPGYNSILRC